ncbi:monovalent cation:proton antiporter-2 (CPA2) family protein [Kaarinaea lacus]
MESTYLVDVIILLIAAVLAVPLFQAIRLGAVPGFLIAGVVVGPHGLGLISNIEDIQHLAEIGVVFLLFVIGIELKPSRLWQMRRLVFGLGTLQILVTGLLLGAIGFFFFDTSPSASILIGPALALSSTAFVLQLLSEQKLLTSNFGRTSLSVLLMQDLAVVPLLALVPLLMMQELTISEEIGLALLESLLILVLVVLVGRIILQPLFHRVALSRNPEIFTATAILLVLGTAVVTEHTGFSMAMGAFLAGLLISDSAYKHQIMAEVQPFRGLLLGLFFMSMGMSLNLALLTDNPLVYIGLVTLLIMLKAAMLFPLTLLFKLTTRNSLAVAIMLGQSGEFALILFSLAFQAGLLAEQLFYQLLLIVLLSMLVTPALSYWSRLLVSKRDTADTGQPEIQEVTPIVLAGYGRVGHRIGEILTIAGQPFVALDSDVDIVDKAREMGRPVFFGDVRKPEVLKAAGASHAKVIIVTLNDAEAAEQVVSSLRQTYPEKSIYARGHSLQQCCELRKLGATGVVSENIEASLELARMVLNDVGLEQGSLQHIISDFRESYHGQINVVMKPDKIEPK